jgi:hypothetical protein
MPETPSQFLLTDKQLATVLASLRMWQANRQEFEDLQLSQFDFFVPLSDEEIDDLCESLNSEYKGILPVSSLPLATIMKTPQLLKGNKFYRIEAVDYLINRSSEHQVHLQVHLVTEPAKPHLNESLYPKESLGRESQELIGESLGPSWGVYEGGWRCRFHRLKAGTKEDLDLLVEKESNEVAGLIESVLLQNGVCLEQAEPVDLFKFRVDPDSFEIVNDLHVAKCSAFLASDPNSDPNSVDLLKLLHPSLCLEGREIDFFGEDLESEWGFYDPTESLATGRDWQSRTIRLYAVNRQQLDSLIELTIESAKELLKWVIRENEVIAAAAETTQS